MYQKKERSCFYIAIFYYLAHMLGLTLMGVLFQRKSAFEDLPYYALFVAAIAIVLIREKRFTSLGFTKEKWKSNLAISLCITVTVFIISTVISDRPVSLLLRISLYYLLKIALVEEMVYRGLIQSYLFGWKAKKYLVYGLGALMFSLSHLPFQMYLHGDVSWGYVLGAMPQLVFTFVLHLIMCFITYKRKDILIPVALHYALNYIQI